MKSSRLPVLLASAAIAAVLGGCANMDQRDRNTAVGAGVGAAAGAILSGGSTGATLIGAGVGGVLGNQIRH